MDFLQLAGREMDLSIDNFLKKPKKLLNTRFRKPQSEYFKGPGFLSSPKPGVSLDFGPLMRNSDMGKTPKRNTPNLRKPRAFEG